VLLPAGTACCSNQIEPVLGGALKSLSTHGCTLMKIRTRNRSCGMLYSPPENKRLTRCCQANGWVLCELACCATAIALSFSKGKPWAWHRVVPMSLLRSLNLPSTLETSRHDITRTFFLPLLSTAIRYDRGVGYFSSGWLRINANGLAAFAANGGKARWITSPILNQSDWDAMINGTRARRDAALRSALERNISDLAASLETQTLSALAWMIADNIIDFRLAVPANELTGEFHAKFGVFTDLEGDQVSFEGSYNDSVQGMRNYESLKIFCSWKPGQVDLVQHDVERFERLWCDEDPNVRVFVLPDAAREQILKLRASERPYVLPRQLAERSERYRRDEPHRPPELRLRDYQEEALHEWFARGCRGIFEMATGTGKTITALAAMARLYGRERRLAIIIACPFQHLVDQWQREALAFGLHPLLAYQRKVDWLKALHQQISEYNHGDRSHFSVITTHSTFIDEDFQQVVRRITGPALLIADEMHHLGADHGRKRLPENLDYRLGLSATPDRWFDDDGTAALREYFGETAFTYPLEDAIGVVLTPYRYFPQLVELTDDELSDYQEMSRKIARLMSSDDPDVKEALEMLLIKRARLLNTAQGKLNALSSILRSLKRVDHALFYCAPEQMDEVCRLLGWEHELAIHPFTAAESNDERQQLLLDFDRGHLDGLVAMKCLDEGVDVPSTRIAFILASSSNPREFIQRRGRILRQSPGKTEATIYDFIAIPPQNWAGSGSFAAEQSIVRHELQRFREFATSAKNKHQAIEVIKQIARRYAIPEV